MQAAALLKKGWSQAEVARSLGVHRQSVSRWARRLGESGRAGLEKAPHAGRPPRLTKADLARIERALQRAPRALGYERGVWTLKRAAKLIAEHCGVRFHPSHISRILRAAGVARQAPTREANTP